MTTPTPSAAEKAPRNARRTLRGIVTSAKMAKTITVKIERNLQHPKYGKYMRRHKQYMAHDEQNEAREGDEVELMSTRPLSKNKRWRLVRVIRRSSMPETATELGAEAGGAPSASPQA